MVEEEEEMELKYLRLCQHNLISEICCQWFTTIPSDDSRVWPNYLTKQLITLEIIHKCYSQKFPRRPCKLNLHNFFHELRHITSKSSVSFSHSFLRVDSLYAHFCVDISSETRKKYLVMSQPWAIHISSERSREKISARHEKKTFFTTQNCERSDTRRAFSRLQRREKNTEKITRCSVNSPRESPISRQN